MADSGSHPGQNYLRVPKVLVGALAGAVWGATLATWVILLAVGFKAGVIILVPWLIATAGTFLGWIAGGFDG